MEILRETKDLEGDTVKIFKSTDKDGVERLYISIDIDVSQDWLKKYTGLFNLANTMLEDNGLHPYIWTATISDPKKDYGNTILKKDDIKTILGAFDKSGSFANKSDKADILRHAFFKDIFK